MDTILSFMLSILAGVITYYIYKWLVASLGNKPPLPKRNKKASEMRPPRLFAVLPMNLILSFCLWQL